MLPNMASWILTLKPKREHNSASQTEPTVIHVRSIGQTAIDALSFTCIIESVSRELPQTHRTFTSCRKESSGSPLTLVSELTCPFDAKSLAPDTCIFLWNTKINKKKKHCGNNEPQFNQEIHCKKRSLTCMYHPLVLQRLPSPMYSF